MDGVRQPGRNAQGVRLVNVDDKDRLQDIAPVVSAEKEEEAAGEEEAEE